MFFWQRAASVYCSCSQREDRSFSYGFKIVLLSIVITSLVEMMVCMDINPWKYLVLSSIILLYSCARGNLQGVSMSAIIIMIYLCLTYNSFRRLPFNIKQPEIDFMSGNVIFPVIGLLIGIVHYMAVKSRERQLKHLRDGYELLFNGVDKGLWDYDIVNNRVCYSRRLMGITGIEHTGRCRSIDDWFGLIHPDDVGRVRESMKKYMERKKDGFACEYRVKTGDGSWKWISGRAKALWDSQGNPIRMIGLAADKSNMEFFCSLSHEFRTPINVLLATLQLMEFYQRNGETGFDSSKMERHISTMKQNCYRLLRLTNNLIDISRLDSGCLDIKLSNHNIVSLVEDITLAAAEYIRDKGIDLIFDTNVEEKIIACDADMIERIILNLLSNAIKSIRPPGRIQVYLQDAGDMVFISVSDTGVGIPEGKVDKVFERFGQVDDFLTRPHEGSGIGLPLVRQLAELHGGRILAYSRFGKGSEFTLELPATVIEGKQSPKAAYESIREHMERINIEFSDIYSS